MNPMLPAFARSAKLSPTDVMSWHYYPQQSGRAFLADRRATEKRLLVPRRLDSVGKHARSLRALAGGRECWMTETGHALYGGEPGLSDTYCSSLWWLDQLGVLAREGTSRVFRQSLTGADYGLLDQAGFAPRPDYYASFLWKRLMGTEVFQSPKIEGPDNRLRAYRHSSVLDGDSSQRSFDQPAELARLRGLRRLPAGTLYRLSPARASVSRYFHEWDSR